MTKGTQTGALGYGQTIAGQRQGECSSFEHYCRIVSPRDWESVSVCMMSLALDGAGKDIPTNKIIVAAGFATLAKFWHEFDDRWNARLAEDGLAYFHADDLPGFRGPFEIWKDRKDRMAKREKLGADLMDIITSCGLRKFGCILHLDDYKTVLKKHGVKHTGWPRFEAFGIAVFHAVEDFHAHARGEGIRKNIRIVIEKGDPETTIRQVMRGHGHEEPDFTWNRPITDRKGFSHDPFYGLQAAGWLAYEYKLDAIRVRGGTLTERWAYRQFEDMRGNIKLLHKRFDEVARIGIQRELADWDARQRVANEHLELLRKLGEQERKRK